MIGVELRRVDGAEGTEVELAFDHPMESGERRDASGTRIPPWYLTSVRLAFDARTLATFSLGAAVSRNPVLTVSLPVGLGAGVFEASWKDNRGNEGSRSLRLERLAESR